MDRIQELRMLAVPMDGSDAEWRRARRAAGILRRILKADERKAKKAAAQKSGVSVGSEYDRLSREFREAGGDRSTCPFDAPGYEYVGPKIHRDGDSVTIRP